MTTLLEIEKAIEQLPQNEYSQLLFWLGVNDQKKNKKNDSPNKNFVQFLLDSPKFDGELDISRDKNDFGRDIEL